MIDAKLAGHVHKLDVKPQSFCGSGFSSFAVCMLAKPYHFGVNWTKTLCENKGGYISLPSNLNTVMAIKQKNSWVGLKIKRLLS